jgi:SAM-dependent methyltransferase
VSYAFRDSDPALRRLEVVADVFEPATRAFLGAVRAARSEPAGRALDLGCAHGRTTLLLADVLGCERAVGIDLSAPFLARGVRRGDPRLAFRRADVAAPPFPGAPFDVVFCRFLLSHLEHPEAALAAWARELAPGGILAVQEVERIESASPVFQRYLGIVEAMLRERGQRLLVGASLDAAPDPPGLARVASEVAELRVPRHDAARMFSPNLEAWRDDPGVLARHGRPALDLLAAALAADAGDAGDPVWGLRQLVWRREGLA